MELVHPTGRKKLVSKKGPQTGAAYGYRIVGSFMSPVGVHKQGDATYSSYTSGR